MTRLELALMLNGTEYPLRIPQDLLAAAKASGLVVISGSSDDNLSLEGALSDEIGCYGGGTVHLDRGGFVPCWEHLDKKHEHTVRTWIARRDRCTEIQARWIKEEPYAWTLETDVPHADFDVWEEGEKWCRAIVVDLADLPDPVS